MKIKKARWKPAKDNYLILHGNQVYNGTLELLIDKFPELEFEQIGNFYYGESEGYCEVYKYESGTKDSFGGRTITLKLKNGETKDFKGCLWDPYSVSNNIPVFRNVSITTEKEVWDRGFTFYSGKIKKELFDKLIRKLKVKGVVVKQFQC